MIPLWLQDAIRLGAFTAMRRGVFRHEYAEDGSSRLRLAFDDAAMVADDLGDKRKA
jgi:hypothetical protein